MVLGKRKRERGREREYVHYGENEFVENAFVTHWILRFVCWVINKHNISQTKWQYEADSAAVYLFTSNNTLL